MHIGFNRPFLTGKETAYIQEAVANGKISGDGLFTRQCQRFFETRYAIKKCLLTSSCTDALEMAALLSGVGPGDEVILPSYTFVSTANPFVMRGAKLIFADSEPDHPNLDTGHVAQLITPRTRVVVAVHYAGHACNMDALLKLQAKHGFMIVEDAAQAIHNHFIDASGQRRALGSIGALGALSFHETKNVICGEGGALFINDNTLFKRSEIIWEKGTNRSAFWRGEVDKYGWVDVGSSFLPSEIQAAFLFAQLEQIEKIQARRQHIRALYDDALQPLKESGISLPVRPSYSGENAHMYYLVLRSGEERDLFIAHMKASQIHPAFHYQSLHRSPFFASQYNGPELPHADHYSECLVRLPMYYELADEHVSRICDTVLRFFRTPM